MYRISFKAKADAGRSASFYVGKASDPWNAYGGYNGVSIGVDEVNFVFTFTMTNPSDPSARLVFDLGKNTTGVTVSEIRVEELEFVITSVSEPELKPKVRFYPNPVSTFLYVEDLERYQTVDLYDLNGRIMTSFDLNSATSSINMESFPQGIYLLRLSGNGHDDRVKIMKE